MRDLGNARSVARRFAPICVLLAVSVTFFLVRRRESKSAQRIAASEAAMAEAQRVAHLGSWTYDPERTESPGPRKCSKSSTAIRKMALHRYAEQLASLSSRRSRRILTPPFTGRSPRGRPSNGFARAPRRRLPAAACSLTPAPSLAPAAKSCGCSARSKTSPNANEAEEACRREAAKLQAMISGMEEGVVFADADNRIVEINDCFCRFVGKPRNELLGKQLEDLHRAPYGIASSATSPVSARRSLPPRWCCSGRSAPWKPSSACSRSIATASTTASCSTSST